MVVNETYAGGSIPPLTTTPLMTTTMPSSPSCSSRTPFHRIPRCRDRGLTSLPISLVFVLVIIACIPTAIVGDQNDPRIRHQTYKNKAPWAPTLIKNNGQIIPDIEKYEAAFPVQWDGEKKRYYMKPEEIEKRQEWPRQYPYNYFEPSSLARSTRPHYTYPALADLPTSVQAVIQKRNKEAVVTTSTGTNTITHTDRDGEDAFSHADAPPPVYRRNTNTDTLEAATDFSADYFVPRNRFLLFTSTGDYPNIAQWTEGRKRNFDVIACYYGDTSLNASLDVDYSFKLKGYKIPALKRLHERILPGVLDAYTAVFALDSDIIISTRKINEMFEITEMKGYDMLTPSQSFDGKVSYPFLKPARFRRQIRHIFFAETNSPLFAVPWLLHLFSLINVHAEPYDWGYDFIWSSIALREERKCGITDFITMTNPLPPDDRPAEIVLHSKKQMYNMAKYTQFRRANPTIKIAYKGALFQSSGSYKLADNPGFGGPPPVKEEPVKRTRVTKTKGRIDHAAIMADLLRQKKEREAKQELRAAGLSAVP